MTAGRIMTAPSLRQPITEGVTEHVNTRQQRQEARHSTSTPASSGLLGSQPAPCFNERQI